MLAIARSSFICYYQLANGQQLCRPLQYLHACSNMHQSGPVAGFRLDNATAGANRDLILTLLYSLTHVMLIGAINLVLVQVSAW